jgi:hypothetical protein
MKFGYNRFTEEELRSRIDELITRADAIQLTDRAYTKELGFWFGQGVFGTPWLMAKIGQLALTYLNISKGQTKKDSEMLLSAPALVALASAADLSKVFHCMHGSKTANVRSSITPIQGERRTVIQPKPQWTDNDGKKVEKHVNTQPSEIYYRR